MDAILQAIESKSEISSSQSSDSGLVSGSQENLSGNEPILYFDERPPQWCIVDKWFTMTVLCNDHSIQELEAVVYNSESEVVKDVEPESNEISGNQDGKSRSKRIVVPLFNVPKSKMYRALFRMRFTNGSKGQWFHIGIHTTSTDSPARCLLKSPPIKVQTNRSKRPRDTKKLAAPPIVSSLSPGKVPSTGNFPGRNDRMMLIFGSNFYLWGKTPIVQLIPVKENSEYDQKGIIEIGPPQLIWWSENLLECQVPDTCSQNTLVRVCNYDMIYGEGKVLKVMETPGRNAEDSRLLDLSKPLGNMIDYQQLTNDHLVLDFIPLVGPDESPSSAASTPTESPTSTPANSDTLKLKAILYVRSDKKFILVNTQSEQDKITLDDLSLQIRFIDYKSKKIIHEFSIDNLEEEKTNRPDGTTFFRNSDNLMVATKIPLDYINSNPTDLVVQVFLKVSDTDQFVLDSSTLVPICAEKYVYQNDIMDGNRVSLNNTDANSKRSIPPTIVSPPLLARSELAALSETKGMTNEMKTAIKYILMGLSSANSVPQIEKWNAILNASFNDLAKKKDDIWSPNQVQLTFPVIKNTNKVQKREDRSDVKQTINSIQQVESMHRSFSPVVSYKNGVPLTSPPVSNNNNNSPAHHNTKLSSSASLPNPSASPTSSQTSTNDDTDSDEEMVVESFGEEQDSRDKTIAVPQNTPIANTFMANVPIDKRPPIIYWKFFNPGTRTFLELSGGKLQIIGSRRIQMLVEGIPPGSKFVGAHLYVHKMSNSPEPQIPLPSQLIATPLPPDSKSTIDRSKKQAHTYEMIENCLRCRENGIPNVFCVLPRRGRENDFPWITFRITCTSTSKHWKGSPFWIGAEFSTDHHVLKVFSPAIFVQSKMRASDIKPANASANSSNSIAQNTPSTSPTNNNNNTNNNNGSIYPICKTLPPNIYVDRTSFMKNNNGKTKPSNPSPIPIPKSPAVKAGPIPPNNPTNPTAFPAPVQVTPPPPTTPSVDSKSTNQSTNRGPEDSSSPQSTPIALPITNSNAAPSNTNTTDSTSPIKTED